MAEHWCKEHQTLFFKKGKMKDYAHPILDEHGEPTGKWCNEPKADVVAKTFEPSRGGSTNDSIESQVAIKEIGLDWREGKLPDDSNEVKVYRLWIRQKTVAGLGGINPPLEGEAQASQKLVAVEVKPAPEPTEGAVVNMEGRDPHSLKTYGDLFGAIWKDCKLTKTQALKAWGYKSQEEIKDIPGCYQFIASTEEARRADLK